MSARWTWKRRQRFVGDTLRTCDFSPGCIWRAEVWRAGDGLWRAALVDKNDQHWWHNWTAKESTIKDAQAAAMRFIGGEGGK